MKSGKQRRAELKTKRKQRKAKQQSLTTRPQPTPRPSERARQRRLAGPTKATARPFMLCAVTIKTHFRCQGCGKEETWTAAQQKWWYEVAKGYVYSTAKLCRPCRKKAQARRAEARRVHLEGVARKKAAHRGD